ncbi:MAG: esterase family protein [Mucilaginibacter sp.]|uniref:alpha/beta hydrolase n=1 Tax=Mucilaginibacter sp. TaxID=1882438 RepID=UPI00261CEA97|nr:alpha/beta hydrolase family protein [Mucilaginibacter sp.]MDB5002501.1 esterase family protein [Mucilaginibacter sp.]
MKKPILKHFITALLLVLAGCVIANAATVDTALTYSNAMHRNIKAVVIKPDNYDSDNRYPTLYLLHGFSGNYTDWITKVPAIKKLADQYHVIIVCPDGAFAGWYLNSPVNKDLRYETYVAVELVNWIDKHYNTITDPSERAITGLSMGGHGALYLAIKHQDVFGAAGSMSGIVDLSPFSESFGIDQVLGKYNTNRENWEQSSVVNLIGLINTKSLAITFDVGVDDFSYKVNLNLHEKLTEKKIPHDFTVRPGAHTWEYWSNSINYQMLYFSRFFNKSIKN